MWSAFRLVMGIAVLGCIAASATFAFEFGWTRGATDVHRWTFALAGVALDLLKSGLPIFGALAWHERRPPQAIACWVVFMVLTGLSLWCAYGTTAIQLASRIASQAVASAKPDGHTLLLMSNGNAVSVGLFKKLPYDTQKGFAPISTLGYFDIGVFVPMGSRFASLKDVVAHAKANPGKLNAGTIAVGSTQHLSAKLFENVAGIDLLLVPYKGSPAVLTALRAGEIDVAFEILGPMLPQVQAGVVKALAVSSDKRNPALPDVPTVIEGGVAGYNVASWNALAAPAGTPHEVIDVLNRAAREAIASPAVKDKLGKLGMRAAASTPAELDRLLASEIKRWGDVIRAAKIEPE